MSSHSPRPSSRSNSHDQRRHNRPILEGAIFLLMLLVSHQIGSSDYELSKNLLVTLAVAFGVRGFLGFGAIITPSGVYMLSLAVFAGLGTFLGAEDEQWGPSQSVLDILSILLVLHAIMYYGFWSRSVDANPVSRGKEADREISVGLFLMIGLGLSVFGVLTRGYSVLGPMPEALCFAGVALASTAAFVRRSFLVEPIGLGVVLITVALYYFNTFDGFGRLRVAALFVAVFFLIATRSRGSLFKKSLVMLILPALYVMSLQRGAGSVISPIYRFESLVQLASKGALEFGYGDTFLASTVMLVPRAVWAEKPEGFGRVLARIFNPQYVENGHSDVALFAGEWFYNFGWIGLVLMIPIVGIFIRRLDDWSLRLAKSDRLSATESILLAVAATLAAGMMDLFWVGSSTFVARTGSRMMVLLLVYGGNRLILTSPPFVNGKSAPNRCQGADMPRDLRRIVNALTTVRGLGNVEQK